MYYYYICVKLLTYLILLNCCLIEYKSIIINLGYDNTKYLMVSGSQLSRYSTILYNLVLSCRGTL